MALKVQYNSSTGKVSYNPTTGRLQVFDRLDCSLLSEPSFEVSVSGLSSCDCSSFGRETFCFVSGNRNFVDLVGDWESFVNRTYVMSEEPSSLTIPVPGGLSLDIYSDQSLPPVKCGGTLCNHFDSDELEMKIFVSRFTGFAIIDARLTIGTFGDFLFFRMDRRCSDGELFSGNECPAGSGYRWFNGGDFSIRELGP